MSLYRKLYDINLRNAKLFEGSIKLIQTYEADAK